MTTAVSHYPASTHRRPRRRGATPCHRLERGARSLADFASALTEASGGPRSRGRRKVGVLCITSQHVPAGDQLAQTLAAGQTVVGVTMDDVHALNAAHAWTTRRSRRGRAEPASDQQRSSRGGHPGAERRGARSGRSVVARRRCSLTCQFMLEDHAVRHSSTTSRVCERR